MNEYPQGIQNHGESPMDIKFHKGQVVTIMEHAPGNGGSSNRTYRITKIDADTATLETDDPADQPIVMSLSDLRNRLAPTQ